MRVLIIHTSYKLKGGEDSVVANEHALLASNNVDVDLLQFSNTAGTLKKIIQLPFNYNAYLTTIERIKTFRPDIVHIHNLHFGGSASVLYALKKCAVPCVMTLHNYRLLCPSATLFFDGERFNNSLKKSFPWKAVFRGVYQHSRLLTFWLSCAMLLHQKLGTYKLVSKFIVLGDYTKELFASSKLSYMPASMIIKPNFCYSEDQFNNSPGRYYLYIGRLSEEKGISTLLNAFSQNKLPLKIAGTGPMASDVEAYSAKFRNIEFLNSVDSAGVNKLLRHAITLIFPSEWLEPFGMVIIEAFSKSVPVIASCLGQLKLTVKNNFNGLHFEPGNVDDLNRAILYFQSLPSNERMAYRKNAFESYQEYYTPEKNVRQLMEIYKAMLVK